MIARAIRRLINREKTDELLLLSDPFTDSRYPGTGAVVSETGPRPDRTGGGRPERG